MSAHSVSLKGLRPQNEDKHNVIRNLDGRDSKLGLVNFYGVYDGHGSKFVSNFIHDNLPQFFTDKRVNYPLEKAYVHKIYSYFTKVLKEKYLDKCLHAGSTCLIVVHYKYNQNEYLNVLNTGDCRALLCRNNVGVALTLDHKPNWPEEHSRITKLGGTIKFDSFDWRINDLSVSRAFGDIDSEPYLTNMPDIFKYKLSSSDKFLVLACDGVTDVLCNQDIINFILHNCYDITTGKRINEKINIAKKLADHALAKDSTDNITCTVVFFN